LLFVGDPMSELSARVSRSGFDVTVAATLKEADHLRGRDWDVVVCALESPEEVASLMMNTKQRPSVFSIVHNASITQDAKLRLECFAHGAVMLANDASAVMDGLAHVARQPKDRGQFVCQICGMSELGEDALHLHVPLYHSMQPEANSIQPQSCPICRIPKAQMERSNFYLHLHNQHGPVDQREPHFPDFNAFTWVVCRRPSDGKFLMVHEPAGLCGGRPAYWLPAGRVDEGESFVEAGMRETLEEGGLACRITGVLQLRLDGGVVPRIILLAEPSDESLQPKSVPCFESCGAMWVEASSLQGLSRADFRSPDPYELFPAVANGILKGESINTASFTALESMVRQLTTETESDSRTWFKQCQKVWHQLRKEYPPICFPRDE